MLHTEVRTLTINFIKIRGPTHKINKLDGCQNARPRAAASISIKKNEKTSVSEARWESKSKKKFKVAGDLFLCVCAAAMLI